MSPLVIIRLSWTIIRALALKEMSDHTVVGMSMALVDDQQVIWSEGFDADKPR